MSRSAASPVEIPALDQSQRLIVKIGSALLIDQGGVRRAWLEGVADDLADLKRAGVQVCVVTSGAVGLGRKRLGLPAGPLKLEAKQAAAAAGMILLTDAYRAAFDRHDIAVAQALLTPGDTEARRAHLNARGAMGALLDLGAVPIINENDTVATAELRFGDNDRLAARVAQMISADTLILLSDIDGLYSADPRKDPTAAHIPVVPELTPQILAMAGEAPPGVSTGGMVTKLEAARIAVAAGCRMAIAAGTLDRPIAALRAGARCTWFLPKGEPLAQRKRWIAATVKPAGSLTVDSGAVAALRGGASLLPAGVRQVRGAFERGDCVQVLGPDGVRLGCGLVAYDALEARAIMGRRSSDIEKALGWRGRDEMIHRDDLVMEG